MNDKYVQLQGPFLANQDLIVLIQKDNPNFKYIRKLGINTEHEHYVDIDGQVFEIGKSGILELDEVKVGSLHFEQDESDLTLVDCLIE